MSQQPNSREREVLKQMTKGASIDWNGEGGTGFLRKNGKTVDVVRSAVLRGMESKGLLDHGKLTEEGRQASEKGRRGRSG